MSDFARYVHNPFHIEAEATPASPPVNATEGVQHLDGGAMRIELRNGQPVTPTVDHTPWHLTARDPITRRPTRDLTDSTLVLFNGMEARLHDLYQAGVVNKDANGNYIVKKAEGSTGEATPVDPKTTGADAEGAEGAASAAERAAGAASAAEWAADSAALPAEVVAKLDAAVAPYDQSAVDGLAAAAIAAAVGEFDSDSMVEGFMRRTGADRAEAEKVVSMAVEAYSDVAAKFVQKAGVHADDVPELFAWARSEAPEALREALQRQIYAQDMSGWREVVRAFAAAVPPSVEALQAGGYQVIKGGNDGRTELVRIGGSWQSVVVAARLGMI